MSSLLTLDSFLTRFQLQPPPIVTPAPPARRQAAVLVPVVARQQPGLLLTRRALQLRKHAGQVAFPGGMRDASDISLHVTALREAHEEIGLQPRQVRIIGTLPAVSSSTGFQVTPVVAIIPPDLRWYPNADEVDAIFEMPLQEALRLSRYAPLDIHRGGLHHRVWLSWYQDYFVWGMTAGIIRQLSLQVMPELNAI
ncbi:CoA pyrophosphatase [Mixta intestinalis]|jgi:8-oxo-dGTP pyrophosphatase MutT (NUDIX family)|uniref:Putative Nudix hydrolase NudL n=1 Tax=Mixta intestinalis TaxID=1615494 RepID=A0A6P1PZE1_9GAMM|nr:CoA pyrophosphatase [Mixta intestinalis]QHM71229.1 putative Nudix hydrolase NudL [Mixta intestinalis]